MYDFLDEDITYDMLNEFLKRKADWLEEVGDRYLDTTKRTYWSILNTRVNFLEVSKKKELYDWNKKEIIQIIKTTATTSKTTKSMLFAIISNYIAWAYKKGYNYVGNPCDSIDTTGLFDVSNEAKKQQYKTLQEFNEFIYGLDCTDVDRAILTLLRYGVPIDNVGTIRWEDIDREKKVLNIYSEEKGLLELPIDNSFIRFIDSAKNCFVKLRKQSKATNKRINRKETDMEDIKYLDYGYVAKATERVDWQHMSAEDVYNKLGNLSTANGINRISVPNLNMSRRFDLLFEKYKQNGMVTNIDIDDVNEIYDNNFTVNKNTRVRREFQLVSGLDITRIKRPNKNKKDGNINNKSHTETPLTDIDDFIDTEDSSYQEGINKAIKDNDEDTLNHEYKSKGKENQVENVKRSTYKRDGKVGALALKLADFKCELNNTHETFVSNATSKNYVEAHHLIPIKYYHYKEFKFSIDNEANIVALCPNCHKRLHFGQPEDKIELLERLYNERKEYLRKAGIEIEWGRLVEMYILLMKE